MARESEYGLTFIGVTYYDGQGFMVSPRDDVNSASRARRRESLRAKRHDDDRQPGRLLLDEQLWRFRKSCPRRRTTRSRNTGAGLCSVLTSDLSQLYALRLAPGETPRSRHPARRDLERAAGPVVRDNDLQWIELVKWVPFRHDQRRGARRQFAQHRPGVLPCKKPEVRRLVGTMGRFRRENGV